MEFIMAKWNKNLCRIGVHMYYGLPFIHKAHPLWFLLEIWCNLLFVILFPIWDVFYISEFIT